MKKVKKYFTLHVKRDVLFEARVEADTLQQALEIATTKSTDELWSLPGSVVDDSHTIEAIFS